MSTFSARCSDRWRLLSEGEKKKAGGWPAFLATCSSEERKGKMKGECEKKWEEEDVPGQSYWLASGASPQRYLDACMRSGWSLNEWLVHRRADGKTNGASVLERYKELQEMDDAIRLVGSRCTASQLAQLQKVRQGKQAELTALIGSAPTDTERIRTKTDLGEFNASPKTERGYLELKRYIERYAAPEDLYPRTTEPGVLEKTKSSKTLKSR